ncbi:L-rhamnose isomerase [Opitutus terrae]|uniref:L-rhamnose isomerase n=1 Tax=Opitutus terrae (strain DSM 11246 / JCM 15787 / PB90-1) TaxID=452637 RepID=B1ZR99_OPITP|nr:L-rhamnose isomerase [Opitutus terrae]ACB74586.1 L-rhamnose isomerase [Opitutus terrae PB90-1]
MSSAKAISAAYKLARDAYADLGIDTEAAIKRALSLPISLHCWQADDVRGLETPKPGLDSGGIMATGGYPGRARNGDEMRADLDLVLNLLPGKQRLNLHAFYAETGAAHVDRDEIEPEHFARWLAWANSRRVGLDFNPTYFAHPHATSGFTLSHPDKAIRKFWINHAKASRRIAQHFAKNLGTPCVNNHWVPDGAKDAPADRWAPRARLVESYDAIFADKSINRKLCVDAVEGKLFGLGSEDYVVGSQEFYSSYAQSRDLVLCLDLGHYHPTESVADKVSALMQFHDRILLHTSRPIRWDSDHVVILDDSTRNLFLEIARGNAWDRVFVALDFFDASINRIAAYVIGARATRQAILLGLLDPSQQLREAETAGRGHERLALMEQAKALPWGAVWDELCVRDDVPARADWLAAVARYERDVLAKR